MATINQLSAVDSLQGGDQIPVYDASNGDARKASMSTVLDYIESNFASPDFNTRVLAPSVDGFNVDVGNTGTSTWLIIQPTSDFTIGSVTLPPATSAANDQVVIVVLTKEISNFSITSVGATVLGAPTSIEEYTAFSVRYNSSQATWYTLDNSGAGAGGTSNIVAQDFIGDGVTTTFTMTAAPTAAGEGLQVFIDGVYQNRDTYSLSGLDVVFTQAPPLNSEIEVLRWDVNDIGATTANLVSYTPAGNNAVLRTVEEKLRETVSVKDFGAVGDGVTDDTAAIQAALDSGAISVYVPVGTYIVSERFILTSAMSGITIKGDGYNSVIAFTGIHSANKGVFTIPANGDSDGGTEDGADNVTIKCLRITGSSAVMSSGVSSGIRCFHGTGHKFISLYTHGFTHQGMYLNCIGSVEFSVIVDGLYSYDNSDGASLGQGIGIESGNTDTTRIIVNNSFLYNNGGPGYGKGFNIGSGSATFNNVEAWGNGSGAGKTSGNDSQHVIFNNCNFSNNTNPAAQGFTTTGTFKVLEFNNCIFENNGDHGLQVDHAGTVLLNNVYAKGNGDIGVVIDTTNLIASNIAVHGNTNQGIRLEGGGDYQINAISSTGNGRFGVQIANTGVCHINSIVSVDDCSSGTDSIAVYSQTTSSSLDLYIGSVFVSDSATNVLTGVELNVNTTNALIGKVMVSSVATPYTDAGTGNKNTYNLLP